ncbi:hypothetical protein PPTG_20920 [Phytophthora nicotianae INRA-310]|uniref:Secreted protein n=1 Tax=Phytophthora nicotianae (strain INRA-310) TaxID=761204 RepID=W2RAM8_PHYN3|nr:hypothetical protein PPTG_20920 [Phytophthora nicotianae INRA-310]ETN22422.1 hypothetical protein PPTG_20920 [Phytophthora nicotianae INRA-310]
MPLSDLTARLSAAILLMLHGAGISMMESSRKGHWWCDSGCSEHGWRAAKGIVGAAQGAVNTGVVTFGYQHGICTMYFRMCDAGVEM